MRNLIHIHTAIPSLMLAGAASGPAQQNANSDLARATHKDRAEPSVLT
jgi:hypothetical protein